MPIERLALPRKFEENVVALRLNRFQIRASHCTMLLDCLNGLKSGQIPATVQREHLWRTGYGMEHERG